MKNLLINSCNNLNIDINNHQIEQFLKYKNILLEWNKKINLTSILDDREIILKHFIDSIIPIKFLDFNNKNVIDVGTGAGFPSIPIKIMQDSINLTLLDSLNKRIKFLENLSIELELNNLKFLHIRAEQGGKDLNLREKFDYCLSRAVAKLCVLVEYTLPFVKIGGSLICLKGSNIDLEIKEAQKSIKVLGGEISDIKKFNLPFTDINHSLIFIEKIRQTPNKYPRKEGKISKNPIN